MISFYESSQWIFVFIQCLEDFADEQTAIEIKTFFDAADTPIVKRSVQQVVETVNMRAKVLQRDSKAIAEYLAQQ